MPKNKVFKEKSAKISDVKQFVYDELVNILSYLKTIEQLEPELLKKGIECKTTFNKNGLSGVSFRYNNQAYKGSQIGIKSKDITKAIQENKVLGIKQHITSLNVFLKKIENALVNIVKDYENGNARPDFTKYFKDQEINLESKDLFYKGYRISNKPIEYFRKTAETYVLGALNDFEYQKHDYNNLMEQQPEKVPLLFGRDKVLTENKKLLKEQQAAIEPKLKIKINRSNIPDYATAFMKGIQEHKEKLSALTNVDKGNPKIVVIEKVFDSSIRNKKGITRRF